jgi:hypothetical protein
MSFYLNRDDPKTTSYICETENTAIISVSGSQAIHEPVVVLDLEKWALPLEDVLKV